MAQSSLLYTRQFATKHFVGNDIKDAYMQAVKWYATNIIAHKSFGSVQVEFVKDKKEPKVTMKLFASLPANEIQEQHCKICKEMHSSFFVSEQVDCNRCSAKGYQWRLEHRIGVKCTYYTESIQKYAASTKGPKLLVELDKNQSEDDDDE